MPEARKHGWKEFFQLIFKSKLPWGYYILGLVAMIVSTTIALGLPLVAQQIMEGQIFDNKLIMSYVGWSIVSAIIVSTSAFFFAITAPKTLRSIQKTIWTKFIKIPMSVFIKKPSLQLITRVTSDGKFIDGVISQFKTVINSTYGFIGSLLIMYGMNAKLTLALLPVIPYMLIVSAVVGHFTQKTQNGVQTKYSGLNAYFAERLPKIRLIKAFGKEKKESELGDQMIQQQYTADRKRAFVDLYAEPLMQSVHAIILGIILIYGGILANKGEIKVSEVVAFYMYIGFTYSNVLQYGLFWQGIKAAKGASERISAILDSKSELVKREESFVSALNQSNGDIKLQNVTFSYEDKNVLKNIDFTIPNGKLTAIVGPSGGGKTTIFNLLERFYEPNVGHILLGDRSIEKIHLNEWRASFSYVSQSSQLLSGTIRENITYGVDYDVTDEEVRYAAEMADALDFIEEFPDGFNTEVGEFGSKLSGGQRQRIAIARAFIKNPQYLLLDEATSNIDARSEHAIKEALKKLMKGRTTIVIAHDINTVKEADQIVVIDAGKVSGIGQHSELYKKNSLYRNLVEIQFEKNQKLVSALS
ncbi:ABC transporter ATP-binding protein [Metabacillus fastidiosus]|uniref:ABC transporter ATP-binding protein n=1 Tax=Metabacillus fastidiosus TaxID=1458 RepID=UPI000826555C|nr:ABC transporter ATP-binding protein [Metabacillus fastidiosus]MED4462493.1 ABC transporter ATP-binding protein [Metabacillus fastidiosus]